MSKSVLPPRRLTKEDIFAADDIVTVDVPVPQWGGSVTIKTFTKKQADKIRKDATRYNQRTRQDEVDGDKMEALLFIEGMVEPKLTLEDYEKLREKSAVPVTIILQAIMKASGLSEAAIADADKSTGQRFGAALRVPVGAGVGDDAGPVA